jgi:hypothetical protein
MISSPEFFSSAGGDNTGWVTELYRRLLNREPEQSGLDFWVGRVSSGELTREQVVLGFVRSDENFISLVDGWHRQYLGRPASAVESDDYVGQLRDGASQRTIQIQIIDTLEYRNTPPRPAAGTIARLP